MSSAIEYRDQFFYVSNARFFALIDFSLEVGEASAGSEAERVYVANLRENSSAFYPGYDLAIEKEFPTLDERKFWARVFFDVSYLIFQRKLGNQETSFWQHSASGDAYLCARMLTRSVQEEELAWYPKTMASLDAEAFQKGLNVRL